MDAPFLQTRADLQRAILAPDAAHRLEEHFEKLQAHYDAVFSHLGTMVCERFGETYSGVYWTGGSNVKPLMVMRGNWAVHGFGYDLADRPHDKSAPVRQAGCAVLDFDLKRLNEKHIQNLSFEVALIKDPGNNYPTFWPGLWHAASKTLARGGWLISDIPLARMCPNPKLQDQAPITRLINEVTAQLKLVPLEPQPFLLDLDQEGMLLNLHERPFYLYEKL